MVNDPVAFLKTLFNAAVDAADPAKVLPKYLPEDRTGRCIVIGAGKAAGAMAAALDSAWEGPLSGLVVTRYGHGVDCERIEVMEAAHPVPDSAGEEVSKRILQLVSGLTEDDQVIFLLSGGGSALLSLPAPGVTLQDKQQVNRGLLRSGATISEINCVRKHLSAIKGGRLARACWPAKVHTFAISDVPGDDPAVIASGPTVPDPTTSAQAKAILERYEIEAPVSVWAWLDNPESETLKADDPVFKRCRYTMIATPQQSLEAAAERVRQAGLEVVILSDRIEGESRDIAKMHGGIAQQVQAHWQPKAAPCVILSGGETTVTVTGNGRGGRNAEFLLSLTDYLRGQKGIYALAGDTDGIDGSEDNAGAIMTPETYIRALNRGMSPDQWLANNDGYGFFEALGDLIITGPTLTNVNDFRALLVV